MNTNTQKQQSQKAQKRSQVVSEAVKQLLEKTARRRREAIIAHLLRNEEIRNNGGFVRPQ